MNNEGLTRPGKPDTSHSELSLVAYGREGDWEVSVDELEAGDSSEWYTHIVAPHISLHARIPHLDIAREVLAFLETRARPGVSPAPSLQIGSFADLVVELIRDTEFAGRFFVLIGGSGRSTIRFTILPSEVEPLEQALQQVLEDLREEQLLS